MSCGPQFPEILQLERNAALKEPPQAFFTREINKLYEQALQDLPVVETRLYEEDKASISKIVIIGLSTEDAAKIARMREQANGDAAYALGEGLPEAIRLYTAGAVDFHNAQPPLAEPEEGLQELTVEPFELTPEDTKPLMEKAKQRFNAVLALPAEQNSSRVLWATFTLGRIAAYQDDRILAADYFAKTRQLVKSGLTDPLGLAVASWGEEARLHLRPGEIINAVELYVQQLAYGSKNAEYSLKAVAHYVEKNPVLLDEALSQSLIQRLIFIDLYTKNVSSPFTTTNYGLGQELDFDVSNPQFQQAAERQAPTNPEIALWIKIVDAIERQGLNNVNGADWLAAAAYTKGQFALAQRLVDLDKSALSLWVKAKLALRAGNEEAALVAYAEVVKAFPADRQPSARDSYEERLPDFNAEDSYFNASLLYRVFAETGILRLSKGEYLQALALLYQSSTRFWADAAYVAEDIVTLDELKQFVDTQVSSPSAVELKNYAEKNQASPAILIRELLARRLFRAGRIDEAIQYFDDSRLNSLAKEYQATLAQTSSRWFTDISKAKAWFKAATIIRWHGMELMGFELSPDYKIWGGEYEYGAIDRSETEDEKLKAARITRDEQQRCTDNQAQPNVRFHYRVLATEHASKAADLLPHSSQAFAAVLCEATRWILVRQPDYAKPLYQRYLREGSYVSWGNYFGQICPEPEFDKATQNWWMERLTALKQPTNMFFILASGIILVFGVMSWGRLKLKQKSAQPPV